MLHANMSSDTAVENAAPYVLTMEFSFFFFPFWSLNRMFLACPPRAHSPLHTFPPLTDICGNTSSEKSEYMTRIHSVPDCLFYGF